MPVPKIYCDVSYIPSRFGPTDRSPYGAYIVNDGEAVIRAVKGLEGFPEQYKHGPYAEVAFICQIIEEFEGKQIIIYHDQKSLNDLLKSNKKRFINNFPWSKLRALVALNPVMLMYCPQDQRTLQYKRCHQASRLGSKRDRDRYNKENQKWLELSESIREMMAKVSAIKVC